MTYKNKFKFKNDFTLININNSVGFSQSVIFVVSHDLKQNFIDIEIVAFTAISLFRWRVRTRVLTLKRLKKNSYYF